MSHVEQPAQLRQDEVHRLQDVDAVWRAHGFDHIEGLMLGLVREAIERFLRRGEDAAAVDAPAGRRVHQAEFDGHPVQARQVDALLLAGPEAELAVGVGEFGEPGVGQQRAVAEDLVEDVRLLQVVQFFRRADEGGDREALARQQLEEGLEGNQRRHARHLPAGGRGEHAVDFVQLRNALVGEGELFDTVQVFLAGAAVEQFQLAFDQGLPDGVLGVRVMDMAVRVRFAGDVLRMFHLTS